MNLILDVFYKLPTQFFIFELKVIKIESSLDHMHMIHIRIKSLVFCWVIAYGIIFNNYFKCTAA